MPKFSDRSDLKLNSAHPELQLLFRTVIEYFDCTILEGHRGEEAQNAAFAAGKSKLQYPQGKHNATPSNAVDVTPYPVDFNDAHRLYYFAGFVIATADALFKQGKMKHKVRWGGNWKQDLNFKANTFNDLVHFELVIP